MPKLSIPHAFLWAVIALTLGGCLTFGTLANNLAPSSPATTPSPFLSTTPRLRTARARIPNATPRPTATRFQTPSLTPTLAPPSSCIPENTLIQLGVVKRVVNGDTIEVMLDQQAVLVGYAGIEAPPSSQAKNSELVQGQMVVLVKDAAEQDTTGRLLRYVMVGDRFINYELVRQGYAVVYSLTAPSCSSEFQQAEAQALAEKLVLWASSPIPTRTFVPTIAAILTGGSACDCSLKWKCSDFQSHSQAQACFNACNDYNSNLDDDHNGIACENLP